MLIYASCLLCRTIELLNSLQPYTYRHYWVWSKSDRMDEFELFRAQSHGTCADSESNSLPSTPRNRKLFSSHHASFRSDRSYSNRWGVDGDAVVAKLADLRVSEIKGRVMERPSSLGSGDGIDMVSAADDDAVFQDSPKHSCGPVHRPHSPMMYQTRVFKLSPDSSHKRSLSCRARVRGPRELPLGGLTPEVGGGGIRRRTYSMPTKNPYRRPRRDRSRESRSPRLSSGAEEDKDPEEEESDDDIVRVRTFSSSAKGFTNRGDSFKRRSTSNQTLCESAVLPQRANSFRQRTWSATSQGSSVGSGGSSSATTPRVHKVLVLGANGVGKTSLIQQFMTSEYMGNTDSVAGES